jgi:predicted RNA-binding protein Jag
VSNPKKRARYYETGDYAVQQFTFKIHLQAYKDDTTDTDPLHLGAHLNSYERKMAHEWAETNGMSHKTEGEGAGRHVVVSK